MDISSEEFNHAVSEYIDSKRSIAVLLEDMLKSSLSYNDETTVIVAIKAITLASDIIYKFVKLPTPDVIGEVEGVRTWIELFGNDENSVSTD